MLKALGVILLLFISFPSFLSQNVVEIDVQHQKNNNNDEGLAKRSISEKANLFTELQRDLNSLHQVVDHIDELTEQLHFGEGEQGHQKADSENSSLGTAFQQYGLLFIILFIHEAWIMLQHANVLLNPLCQHLDRNYGIALLKKQMFWVIAGVLVAYWMREVLSMLLCMGMVSTLTRRMIIISSAYHCVKSVLISIDAHRKYSPKLGIMRLLIDHWHLEDMVDRFISLKRVILQGFDTLTHVMIVIDLTKLDSRCISIFIYTFAFWVIHAIGNQVTRKSTATLFVEAFKILTGENKQGWSSLIETSATDARKRQEKENALDQDAAGSDCIVCKLLTSNSSKVLPEDSMEESHNQPFPYAPCDVAFVGHPTTICSAMAHYTPPSSPDEKWKESWWMYIFWPVLLVISFIHMYISPLFRGPFMVWDKFTYKGISNQAWLSRAFGYHFMIPFFRPRIARNIEDIIRTADSIGVKVIGLGALNKAEFINHGGQDAVAKVQPKRTKVVHGNTLTAAAVMENILKMVAVVEDQGKDREVFLTGPTSKIGRAVALCLCDKGFKVWCYTSSMKRFQALQAEAATVAEGKGQLVHASHLWEGMGCTLWVIGKFDLSVGDHMPRNSIAVNFAVPCPLEDSRRRDIWVVDGGMFEMDMNECTKRLFPLLLPENQVYACHAAAMVHALKSWDHHEVSEIQLCKMKSNLEAAKACGFSIPAFPPRPPSHCSTPLVDSLNFPKAVTVVVVGAGSSGLAMAACLLETGVPEAEVLVLEQQDSICGSWANQYTNMKITTRKTHCSLPYYPVPDDGFDSELSGSDFIRYLQIYAQRFALPIHFKTSVIEASKEEISGDWIITTNRGTLRCQTLVIATGKNAVPKMPPSWESLSQTFDGKVLHSKDVRSYANLSDTNHQTGSEKDKEVVIVGMGNSACDLAIEFLKANPDQKVHMSIRSIPPIVAREWGPLSVEWVSRILCQHLPTSVADRVVDVFDVVIYGWNWKSQFFPKGLPSWRAFSTGRVPIIDKGELVKNLKAGKIVVHGPIEKVEGSSITFQFQESLSQSNMEIGKTVTAAALIFATGFTPSFPTWLDHSCNPYLEKKEDDSLFLIGFSNGNALIPLQKVCQETKLVSKHIFQSRAKFSSKNSVTANAPSS